MKIFLKDSYLFWERTLDNGGVVGMCLPESPTGDNDTNWT